MARPMTVIRGWALIEWPRALPLIVCRTRAGAEAQADPEEQLYRVEVHVLKRVTKRERIAERGTPCVEDVE